MEIAIGLIGLIVAILVWLFPPEPLRRWLGVPSPQPKDVDEALPKKREITSAFKTELERLEVVGDEAYFKQRAPALMKLAPMPRIIEKSKRDQMLAWVDSLDDELLMVTLAIREYWRGKHWHDGVPRRVLHGASHPFGKGRSGPELEHDLIECGVLVPTKDANRFDYGSNLQRALDYVDLVEWTSLSQQAPNKAVNPSGGSGGV